MKKMLKKIKSSRSQTKLLVSPFIQIKGWKFSYPFDKSQMLVEQEHRRNRARKKKGSCFIYLYTSHLKFLKQSSLRDKYQFEF